MVCREIRVVSQLYKCAGELVTRYTRRHRCPGRLLDLVTAALVRNFQEPDRSPKALFATKRRAKGVWFSLNVLSVDTAATNRRRASLHGDMPQVSLWRREAISGR